MSQVPSLQESPQTTMNNRKFPTPYPASSEIPDFPCHPNDGRARQLSPASKPLPSHCLPASSAAAACVTPSPPVRGCTCTSAFLLQFPFVHGTFKMSLVPPKSWPAGPTPWLVLLDVSFPVPSSASCRNGLGSADPHGSLHICEPPSPEPHPQTTTGCSRRQRGLRSPRLPCRFVIHTLVLLAFLQHPRFLPEGQPVFLAPHQPGEDDFGRWGFCSKQAVYTPPFPATLLITLQGWLPVQYQ